MAMRRAATLVVGLVLIAAFATHPTARAARIIGTTGVDTFAGTNNADRIDALGGNDIVFGRDGNDKIFGDDGNDQLFLGAGQDRGVGGSGNDEIIDDDSGGSDVMVAGAGSDLVVSADGGNDTIDCGPGDDIAFVDRADTVRNCERRFSRDNARRALFFGANGADGFIGDDDDADETFFAKGGADQASLQDGDDTVYLGDGPDRVIAGDDDRDGNDVIIDDDGRGGDSISTGADDDIVFSADGAADTINCGGDSDDREDTVFVDRADSTLGCEHVFSA
jgi:Ca2+-binding RTX toxin-like protein